jgi:hypothetical protein
MRSPMTLCSVLSILGAYLTQTGPRLNTEFTKRTEGTERERLARNNSNRVGYVSPLRGLVLRADRIPPLPWWATLFRPWRDCLGVGLLVSPGVGAAMPSATLLSPWREFRALAPAPSALTGTA